ncbi:uncharacterized protein LOC111788109 isoform X3 [Cucurbita pepo subsp. pepo]|uniref:uncharacterized protein LOC111788109 isoform X3 n=1 Tax=Cucurbita pepo subsp. pepo TaxID=3664 RepID=UPI000C9D9AB0|nr:uncharacterized protein LOC111788109 isoform X3 [Cucurbita pepo subsp. pepo]
MDPFDDILSDPSVSSRTGSRFQPKIKPRPKKPTLAPQSCTHSQDKKETVSDAKSCHDGRGNTKSIESSSQLPVIEENKESEDDLLLATARSDFISSHPPSVESAKTVDSMQLDFDSCGSILPSGSTTDDPVGVKKLTDTKNTGILNYSTPSSSTAHEATVLDQSGLGSIQTEDRHFSDGKIPEENIDIFYELEYLDDFHNQPKNEADPASLNQASISSEDGDLDKQRLEIEERGAGADITMDTISSGDTSPSEQPACNYTTKPKIKTAEEDACMEISQPEISDMLPPSPQVISHDTRCMHDTSIGSDFDGILNDSSINFDGYTPVNQHTEAPVNVEPLAFDSYDDILVDDFNSDDQDPSREVVFRVVRLAKENLQWNQIFLSRKRCSPKLVKKSSRAKLRGSRERRFLINLMSQKMVLTRIGISPMKPQKLAHLEEKKLQKSLQNHLVIVKNQLGSASRLINQFPIRKPKSVLRSSPIQLVGIEVNKVLLETPEDEIDFQKISFRDLIIYHEYKEKLEKEASMRKSATNQRTDTAGEEIFNDGEESLASEQGRGTDDEETPDVVDMTSAYFNYHSFMDKTPRIKWSKHDTERFYEAVRQFGTDFCMIQQLFPGKTRHQIKLKFKNEERHHPFRLSDAVTNRATDHTQFLSLIGQLKEAANKAKQESNQDELTENTGDEELPELSPETNEEVAKPEGEEVQETGKEECIGEIHSPLKADENESDEDDPHRWDEYKFDF